MYEFVPAIRTDRFREIKQYKEKGFTFTNENDYILIDQVKIQQNLEEMLTFEVRVTFSEVRFFIIKNSACIYLTIYQLYEILNQITKEGKIDVVYQLKQMIKRKKKEKIKYRGINYEIPKISKFSAKHTIYIPDSNTHITYSELFYLLALVQEKSNYLCSISREMKNFTYGLYRLLIALLTLNQNHQILKKKGWEFDVDNKCFKRNTLQKWKKDIKGYKKHNKIVDRKYYLTEKELKSII